MENNDKYIGMVLDDRYEILEITDPDEMKRIISIGFREKEEVQ